ncbi:MAG: tetratricopeptide repeat protein, partial [Bacteroidaceae bacterium]|nr:tetratricopeptide repeat protein [Bacteroidaceae bacterium]
MTKYLWTILLTLCTLTLHGQTQAQAKALYDEGKFAEAKPALEKLVKQQPSNGNLNLWYGVCCLKTGDAQQAVKYLEQAVKRRTPSGQLYLGMAYNEVFRFEDAVETLEAYRSDLVKRKRDTAEADELLLRSRNGLRQLRGVER